jgi:type II secretory pathway pseudopilin PulG
MRNRNQSGFTLVEVTIILLVLVILSSIMLPQLGNYNRLARYVKAREDVGALCASLKKMLDEVMLNHVALDPKHNGGWSMKPVGLLVGPGSTPEEGSKFNGKGTPGNGHWLLEPGDQFEETYDIGYDKERFYVDRLENHLQQNMPGSGYFSYGTNPYKNPLDNPERWAAGAFFGWRGPYFDELTADPWGNRYAINTFALYKNPESAGNDEIFTSAVVCYSAGPDSGIDTTFNQPMNDRDKDGFYGWRFMDDDIGAILSAGGPM